MQDTAVLVVIIVDDVRFVSRQVFRGLAIEKEGAHMSGDFRHLLQRLSECQYPTIFRNISRRAKLLQPCPGKIQVIRRAYGNGKKSVPEAHNRCRITLLLQILHLLLGVLALPIGIDNNHISCLQLPGYKTLLRCHYRGASGLVTTLTAGCCKCHKAQNNGPFHGNATLLCDNLDTYLREGFLQLPAVGHFVFP